MLLNQATASKALIIDFYKQCLPNGSTIFKKSFCGDCTFIYYKDDKRNMHSFMEVGSGDLKVILIMS